MKKNIAHHIILALSLIIFFSFGFFHLAQFETTDEHLWKYDRIPSYWNALKTKQWEETYINDKPGVTVALVSGIGLFSVPDPAASEYQNTRNKLFEEYDTEAAVTTNFAFRLPVLIFSTLSLILFYFFARKSFGKNIALIFTALLATNPILIGMAQIINPDSFFWIFGSLTFLSYITLLKTKENKYLYITGLLMGFALLSKYTAFTLFTALAIYGLISILYDQTSKSRDLIRFVIQLLIIGVLGLLIFALFLPAVIVEPQLVFKGLSQFITLKKVVFLAFIGGIAALPFIFWEKGVNIALGQVQKLKSYFAIFVIILFSLTIGFNFINTWTDQKMIPFDGIRDAVYANEPQAFNFKPYLKGVPKIEKKFKAFFIESYPLTFSLTPLVLLATFSSIALAFRKKLPDALMPLLVTTTGFTLIYFLLTVFARVITNVRYSIILYSFFTLLTATLIAFLFQKYKLKLQHQYGIIFLIILLQVLVLLHVRPFYFSYANLMLPSQFSVHDSWGHGSYEIAQYLNAKENAENLIIWSNSDTVCRFFTGKCLRSRKIDLSLVTPDYFVISKRGSIKLRNHFKFLNNPPGDHDAEYYFESIDTLKEHEILINNRTDNYIKVLPYESKTTK